MDSAIHWINHYSLDNAIANSNTDTYPLDLVPIYPGWSAIQTLNNGRLETTTAIHHCFL